jgi:hypothetical protein
LLGELFHQKYLIIFTASFAKRCNRLPQMSYHSSGHKERGLKGYDSFARLHRCRTSQFKPRNRIASSANRPFSIDGMLGPLGLEKKPEKWLHPLK